MATRVHWRLHRNRMHRDQIEAVLILAFAIILLGILWWQM